MPDRDPQVSGFRFPPSPDDLVARFRGPTRQRAPLHPLEKVVLVLTCLHLGFLPWALGTMHAWSQVTSLALAAVGFVIAILPRTYAGDYALALPLRDSGSKVQGTGSGPRPSGPASVHQSPITNFQSPSTTHNPPATIHPTHYPLPSTLSSSHASQSTIHHPPSSIHYQPWRRLVRFPLFWLGGALLLYICVQALNPSWVWERNETTWWLRRVNDIAWLPTSIDAPWERFNLWRQFIIYASAWLTVCALWIGLTRRRSLEILLHFLVVNGTIFGIAGLYLRATATTDTVLWINARVPFTTAFASFYYRNHAGAYVGLITMTALALAILVFARGRRHFLKSTPTALLLLAVGFLFICQYFTFARGATLMLLGCLLASAVYLTAKALVERTWSTALRGPASALGAIFAVLALVVVWQVDFSQMNARMHSLGANWDREFSVQSRLLAFDAASSMFRHEGLRGVGAGEFRYLFPEYVKRHPSIYRDGRLFWEHAHNDWLQVPIELGLGGTGLIALGGLMSLRKFVRLRLWQHAPALLLVFACGQTLGHAWFDFPFQNPAVLVTWLCLGFCAIRLVELDGVEEK